MHASVADEASLGDIVDRIVREFRPLRIMLFGSRARGDEHDGSDVDLLVVLPRVLDRRETNVALRRAASGAAISIDVFTTDPAEIERTGDSVGSFLHPVLREGRVIYGVDDRDAKVWLRYAEEDLETAERMLAGRGFALRWACYLGQQAAEKAIKAVLTAEAIRFPYTDDLGKLRDLVPGGARLATVDADLEALTQWADAGRYPAATDATEADAGNAVSTARAVVEAATEDVSRPRDPPE